MKAPTKSKTSHLQSDQFDLIWSLLPHPTPEHVVRVFSRRGEERDGDHIRNVKELKKYAKIKKEHNVYLAPNPTTSTVGTRHSAKDVSHWSYFLIDMDPIEDKYDARAALDLALDQFGEWVGKNFHTRRPLIIDSGRGMQAWIRLDDVPFVDDANAATIYDRGTARRVNGYWLKKLEERLGTVHGCRIDTSVSDLPRVMRCPGTVNVKTGKMAFVDVASDAIYLGLAELMVNLAPRSISAEPPPVMELKPGQRWQKVFPHLTRSAQDYLLYGQAEPGRHKVMWHTIQKFHELGVTREEAQKAIRKANKLKGPKQELPEKDIQDRLKAVYEA